MGKAIYPETAKAKQTAAALSQQARLYSEAISTWKATPVTGITKAGHVSGYVRRYIREKFDNRCTKCGWKETNSFHGNVPTQIEHIDGNPFNNNEDNLTILCPNCHSLTRSYGAYNIGSGRAIRKRTHDLDPTVLSKWSAPKDSNLQPVD